MNDNDFWKKVESAFSAAGNVANITVPYAGKRYTVARNGGGYAIIG